jgi:hypothetical protein
MVTVGSILGATFRFAGDNVRAILVWSGIIFLMSLVTMLIMRPFYAAQVAALQGGAVAPPNVGMLFLTITLSLLVFVVLWAAVFRAVLFPKESRFAYLRVGMDELRLLGCVLALLIAFYLIIAICGIVLGLIVGLLGAAIGGMGAVSATIIFSALGMLILGLWLGTRFSVAGPLTLLERKVIVGPAWRTTRGNFWPLLGAYVVIVLLLVALYTPVMFARGVSFGTMFKPLGIDTQLQVASAQAARYTLSLKNVAISLVISVIGGFALALHAGAIGIAAAQLLNRRGQQQLSEVFE